MASQSSSLFLVIFFIYAASISSSLLATAHEQDGDEEIRSVGRRFLLGFKETPKGSNVTFACSPSGPCVSCNSSEKDGREEVIQAWYMDDSEEIEKREAFKRQGHGEYREEFYRCKIMYNHLKTLAPRHVDTKFIKVDTENAPFFVTKLAIKTLPCVVLFRLCLIMLINKSEKAITLKADGLETLTPNQDQEASSEVLSITFNGLAKAKEAQMKAIKSSIFYWSWHKQTLCSCGKHLLHVSSSKQCALAANNEILQQPAIDEVPFMLQIS